MTLAGSGILGNDVKVKCLRTIVCGEALCLFVFMYADVEGTNPLTL